MGTGLEAINGVHAGATRRDRLNAPKGFEEEDIADRPPPGHTAVSEIHDPGRGGGGFFPNFPVGPFGALHIQGDRRPVALCLHPVGPPAGGVAVEDAVNGDAGRHLDLIEVGGG